MPSDIPDDLQILLDSIRDAEPTAEAVTRGRRIANLLRGDA